MDDDKEWVLHSIPIEELCVNLDTNLKTGLTSNQAAEAYALHGANFLTPPPTKPEWMKLCGSLLSGPSLPLWLGAVPCFVAYGTGYGVGHLFLGASLSSMVTVSGIYSYYQEAKASKIVEQMTRLMNTYALVLRNGEKLNMNAKELTLGDIVYVKQGDIVPADIRILESQGLKVDNSNLTGESEPQWRSTESTHDNPLETRNLAFYATGVAEGSGVGVVVNIGDKTVMGQIASRASFMETPTFISSGLDRFLFRLSSTVCIGAGLWYLAYAKDYKWLYPIIAGLGGAIPSYMYACVNADIKDAFYSLAAHNTFVKNANALETLGAISCLCTTKTGTITQNRMTVTKVWFDNEIYFPDYSGNEWHGIEKSSWKILERAAVLCNSAEFKPGQEGMAENRRECNGNATDAAILKITAATTNDSVMEYREKYEKVCEIPFNKIAFNKFQLSIHRIAEADEGGYLVVVKGAPERILEFCSTILKDGTDSPIDQQVKSDIEAAVKGFARQGERVIAFCNLMLPQKEYPIGYAFDADERNFPMQGFQFVGLMSLMDPPRAAVPDTIGKLRNHHNMRIVMLTGEHPITATAFAKAVGIISEGNETVQDIADRKKISIEEVNPRDASAAVIHGNDLRDMSTDDIHEILTHHTEVVFARVSPQQKYKIVWALKQFDHLVAVIGNENEVISLKSADLGIAMGICGSDQAKNAADMILLDDNYASIFRGVEESKYMFSSLRKYGVLPQLGKREVF